MNARHIESRFAAMGARPKVLEIASRWQMGNRKWIDPVNYAVDIRRDRDGAFFELFRTAARRFTYARSIRTAFPKRNTPSCSA